MTTVYCSKKFGDLLGKERFATSARLIESELGDWNGHVFFYQRKKYLMFVNNKTYYSVLFPPFKKADLKDFENVFLQRLLDQLVLDKIISHDEMLIVLQKLLPFALARTNNDKKAIGTLNDFIFQAKYMLEDSHWSTDIGEINSSLNDSLVGAGRSLQARYGRPLKDMKALIDSLS